MCQGDPLSLFLFVLVGDILNRLLHKAASIGLIKGIKIGCHEVPLSHLQFADDTLLLLTPAKESILNLKRILDCFGLISRLKINYNKSALFPVNCNDGIIASLNHKLKCMVSSLPTSYLGIPLGANPQRIETWKPIINKIKKKLNGWKINLLSRAGRLTLIKAALNNLPIYYLGLFKMPKSVAKKIISLQLKKFWGLKDHGSAMPLISWEIIHKPKKFGGLGVSSLLMKNVPLLFKW